MQEKRLQAGSNYILRLGLKSTEAENALHHSHWSVLESCLFYSRRGSDYGRWVDGCGRKKNSSFHQKGKLKIKDNTASATLFARWKAQQKQTQQKQTQHCIQSPLTSEALISSTCRSTRMRRFADSVTILPFLYQVMVGGGTALDSHSRITDLPTSTFNTTGESPLLSRILGGTGRREGGGYMDRQVMM